VERYRSRVSGPLLDRIDIHLEVPTVPYADPVGLGPAEPSAAIRERVERARAQPGVHANANSRACKAPLAKAKRR
jgi:magnesium chelatase family protein